MKKSYKLHHIIFFILLFSISLSIPAQKSISAQEQAIENKIRLSELEKKVDAQEQEMQSASDKKQASLETKLELKKENLEYKSNWVNYLLAILGILITFFGIGIPIAAVYYGRKFYKEIEEEKDKAKTELNNFKSEFKTDLDRLIRDSGSRIEQLEIRGKYCIEIIEKNLKKSNDNLQKMDDDIKNFDDLKKNFTNKLLSSKDKNDSITKAIEIVNDSGNSKFEKDMADAMKLYYSDDEKSSKDKFIEIIKKYPKEISIEKLSEIYFYIAYIYYLEKNYNESIDYYNNSIKLDSNDSDTWQYLGLCYGDIPNEEKAIECYKKAIELNEKNEYAIKNLIEILLITGQFSQVEKYFHNLKCIKEKNDFEISFLEIIYLLLTDKLIKNVHEIFEELKTNSNNDIAKIDWSFEVMINWLNSDKSAFITSDQRLFITELIRLIEEWIKGDNKE